MNKYDYTQALKQLDEDAARPFDWQDKLVFGWAVASAIALAVILVTT